MGCILGFYWYDLWHNRHCKVFFFFFFRCFPVFINEVVSNIPIFISEMLKRISNGIKRNKIYANRKWKIFAIRIEIIIPLLLPHLRVFFCGIEGLMPLYVSACNIAYTHQISIYPFYSFSPANGCPEEVEKNKKGNFMTFTQWQRLSHGYWLIFFLSCSFFPFHPVECVDTTLTIA